MKQLFIILLFFSLICFSQKTFIENNINTKWINGTNELSFLENENDNKNAYKAVTTKSYIFYIELDKDVYTPDELNNERLLNCCMCSYTAITQNSRDTLKVEKGSRDDFGNSKVIINTFYLKEDNLIQFKHIDKEPPTLTIWSRVY